MANSLWLIMTAAIGTFLQRFIPFHLAHRMGKGRSMNRGFESFLERIGPAAIASLLIVSLTPDLRMQSNGQVIAIVIALSVVFLVKRLLGGGTIATLSGALVYGFIFWIYSWL